MGEAIRISEVPVPEQVLRDLARNVAKFLPDFAKSDPSKGVKEFKEFVSPLLETADHSGIPATHRASASNALCTIIEHCQKSSTEWVRVAILDDFIWTRLFDIYLRWSNDAVGKSMRQLLLVLTSVITKEHSARALELRRQATTTFLNIICLRSDRTKVKPALQGLAHFLLRDVVTAFDLVDIHSKFVNSRSGNDAALSPSQILFKSFLAWVVHHDTALSAGHLVKNFLIQIRRLPNNDMQLDTDKLPIWVKPVVQTIQGWPDRIREFKTHVFPHCFVPIEEYMLFLSYLHFQTHLQPKGTLPEELRAYEDLENGLNGPEEFNILLVAITSGKELTILRDNDSRLNSNITISDGAIHVPDDILGAWMAHPEPDVRLAGMFLSIYSSAITKPMTGGVLKSLKHNLIHLHTDTDANFRREIHGYTQKLFDRLRASTATLSRSKTRGTALSQSRLPFPKSSAGLELLNTRGIQQDPLEEALAFVVWYVRFLEWEMRSTASYQRRITALRSLTIVLRSGVDPGVPFSHLSKSAQGQLNWAHGMQVANSKLIRVLMDLILDPFDDIRDAAISVLQLCLIALPDIEKQKVLGAMPRFLSRAEATMLRTGRADQADGVARTYGLMFSLASQTPTGMEQNPFASQLSIFELLEKQVHDTLTLAHANLSEAVNGRPVHGTFAALRYIIDQDDFYSILSTANGKTSDDWISLHKRIIDSIESLWNCVYHVLCADAPEGHVPEEIEDESSLDTKEILSYSWRGLKEASVLLRTIVSKAPIGYGEADVITPELFAKLGKLCFTQLLELRHRGAFSTVSQTFAVFCRRCASSDIETLRSLPDIWYKETLKSMQDKADAITRRSAGIPALMTGIMAAEPQPGGKLFPLAMKDLIAEASTEAQSTNIEESRLPQVHALNCIKEIFTTSRLSVASESYIGEGLELAAKMLNSKIWPIRNCSLMLFKALIERLLGSDEAQDWKEIDRQKTSRFSYVNYPGLIPILSDLLDPTGPLKQSIESTPENSSPLDLHGAEGVFPGLQILRQAQPPETVLGPLLVSVEKLLASPHWHLRDMVARTVVSLRPSRQLYSASMVLLNARPASHNTQHGVLLTAKYMLRKLLRDSALEGSVDLQPLMKEVTRFSQNWYTVSDCPQIRAAYLDIVSLIGMTMLQRQAAKELLPTWVELAASVSIGPEYQLGVSKRSGVALFRQSLAQIFFIDRVITRRKKLGEAGSEDDISPALSMLAKKDPDSCIRALETLEEITQFGPSVTVCSSHTLLGFIFRIILDCTDQEVVSKAQAVIANGLADAKQEARKKFFRHVDKALVPGFIRHLEDQCLNGPPSNVQSGLQLLGLFLDHAYHYLPEQQQLVIETTARYIRLLRMTIVDTNPFDTRFAAVQSIAALHHLWTAPTNSQPTGPLLLGLSLILFDLLDDDDDEVRILAATATSTFLTQQNSSPSKETVPLLTAHRLSSFLSTTYSSSPLLASEALRRLTSTPAPTPLFSTPFEVSFAEVRKEDSALFATEKQNLYKDTALDALLWSRVLLSLDTSALPSSVRGKLATYTLDALSILTATFSPAQGGIDGPLGLTSKPETFALGIGVLCLADVALRFTSDTAQRGALLSSLKRFAEEGEKSEVHGLWIERAERGLEREVVGALARLNGGLEKVGDGAFVFT